MFPRAHARVRRVVFAAGVAALGLTVIGADAASADQFHREPPPRFSVDGFGSYALDDSGSAVVGATGNLYRRGAPRKPLAVEMTATLTADDGTLPGPEECESATATISAFGSRRYKELQLVGRGEVCGHYLQLPTSAVTHSFTGRYQVVEGPRIALGTDGFFEVRLGDGNVASAFAIDT